MVDFNGEERPGRWDIPLPSTSRGPGLEAESPEVGGAGVGIVGQPEPCSHNDWRLPSVHLWRHPARHWEPEGGRHHQRHRVLRAWSSHRDLPHVCCWTWTAG